MRVQREWQGIIPTVHRCPHLLNKAVRGDPAWQVNFDVPTIVRGGPGRCITGITSFRGPLSANTSRDNSVSPGCIDAAARLRRRAGTARWSTAPTSSRIPLPLWDPSAAQAAPGNAGREMAGGYLSHVGKNIPPIMQRPL